MHPLFGAVFLHHDSVGRFGGGGAGHGHDHHAKSRLKGQAHSVDFDIAFRQTITTAFFVGCCGCGRASPRGTTEISTLNATRDQRRREDDMPSHRLGAK